MKKYVGIVEPHEGVGSSYNAGTIWEEQEDGNFMRLGQEGPIKSTVRRDTFLRFVAKGYLAPMYPCAGMEEKWNMDVQRNTERLKARYPELFETKDNENIR